MNFHLHNADFMAHVGRPSQARTGQTFDLPEDCLGYEGPACRGRQVVVIPAGRYTIVSRKGFVGGTQEIAPAK